MKILIVDDNADDRRLLRYIIERKGHEVIEAGNGLEGLEVGRAQRPDLVVSDALMPEMDGFQFLKMIKMDEDLKSTPFVFHSAVYTGLKDRELALSLGAEAFIVKPKEPEQFWEELAAVLQRGKSCKGKPPAAELFEEEKEYLRKYSSVVAAKLEEKVRELEVTLEQYKMTEEALRRSEIRYRKLFEASKDGILIFNAISGEVIDVNPFMIDLLGFPPEEYMGKKFCETGPLKGSEAGAALFRELQSTDYFRYADIAMRTSGGLVVDVEFVGCRYTIDEAVLVQCNIRDITERKRLMDLSYQDGLTGISNRRLFDRQLEQEWRRCARRNSPLSLIMVDIDYFKSYNDSYGHLQGDECLKLVATCIEGKVRRAGDLVARYGGEEFIALLPDTDVKGAGIVAEAMRSAVAALNMPHAMSLAAERVTISLGVAGDIPVCRRDPHDLVMAADIALYRAKSAGRDRVNIESPAYVDPGSKG